MGGPGEGLRTHRRVSIAAGALGVVARAEVGYKTQGPSVYAYAHSWLSLLFNATAGAPALSSYHPAPMPGQQLLSCHQPQSPLTPPPHPTNLPCLRPRTPTSPPSHP